MKELEKSRHIGLIEKISELVSQSRTEVARAINSKIVQTYWTVGKHIVEYEQKGKVRADFKRRFYEKETKKNNYLALSQRGQIIEKPDDMVKDPYILEFLGLPESEKLSETKLESALIKHLRDFLLELGRGFSFVDRQHRITMNNEHHYVDLAFYSIYLRCYVLIDLKTRKFGHEDAGQMNSYLNYFRNEVNSEGDNPPIGIILCLERDKVFVDYVLGGLSNKIFASKYMLRLPTQKELADEVKKDIQGK